MTTTGAQTAVGPSPTPAPGDQTGVRSAEVGGAWPCAAEVLRAAASGDGEAWKSLIARYANMIRAIARSHRLGSADVADIEQIVWVRLLERLSDIRDPECLGGWLATTTRRECRRLQDRSRRRSTLEERAYYDRPVTRSVLPDASLLEEERRVAVRRAVDTLDPRGRRLLTTLVLAEEPLSYLEASRTLDLPVGSIGPFRGRYLDRLRHSPELMAVASS